MHAFLLLLLELDCVTLLGNNCLLSLLTSAQS